MGIRIFTSRGRRSGLAGPQAQHPLGGQLLHEVKSAGANNHQAQHPLGGQLLHEVKSVGALN